MAKEAITMTGVKETQRRLLTFPAKYRLRVIRKGVRAGANVIARTARKLAPKAKRHRGPTKPLRKGIRVFTSKIHTGKRGSKLVGVYINIPARKKGEPYYGRFQELGWNTAGKYRFGKNTRRTITAIFGKRTGRKTLPGKTNVPGKFFMDRSFDIAKERALSKIREVIIKETPIMAKKEGL